MKLEKNKIIERNEQRTVLPGLFRLWSRCYDPQVKLVQTDSLVTGQVLRVAQIATKLSKEAHLSPEHSKFMLIAVPNCLSNLEYPN